MNGRRLFIREQAEKNADALIAQGKKLLQDGTICKRFIRKLLKKGILKKTVKLRRIKFVHKQIKRTDGFV